MIGVSDQRTQATVRVSAGTDQGSWRKAPRDGPGPVCPCSTPPLKAADVGDRVRQAAETIYQALIEAELTAVIGAAPHERSTDRNGPHPDHPGRGPKAAYIREDAVLDAVSRFPADRVFGPHRRDILAADLATVDDRQTQERAPSGNNCGASWRMSPGDRIRSCGGRRTETPVIRSPRPCVAYSTTLTNRCAPP